MLGQGVERRRPDMGHVVRMVGKAPATISMPHKRKKGGRLAEKALAQAAETVQKILPEMPMDLPQSSGNPPA